MAEYDFDELNEELNRWLKPPLENVRGALNRVMETPTDRLLARVRGPGGALFPLGHPPAGRSFDRKEQQEIQEALVMAQKIVLLALEMAIICKKIESVARAGKIDAYDLDEVVRKISRMATVLSRYKPIVDVYGKYLAKWELLELTRAELMGNLDDAVLKLEVETAILGLK